MKLWPFSRKSDGSDVADGPMALLKALLGTRNSKSGQRVTPKTALEVTTVFACVRAIANGVAKVPLKLYREDANGSKSPARDHPLFFLLHRRPNEWQTSFEYRETIIFHAMLAKGHFSYINRVRGQIAELIPFEPGMVTVIRQPDDSLIYRVQFPTGKVRDFPADVIWHVRGPSWNGYEAVEAVRMAREAIGLAMALEEQHANIHRNGVMPTGVYSVEGTLGEKQHRELREFIKENYTGVNGGLPMVLDRSAKWQGLSRSGVDNQHLETRRFQVEEICRGLGCMPIMVFQFDKGMAYGSSEQMFLAHIVNDLAPWFERLQQSIDVRLLTDEDRAEGIYSKFVIAALLHAALKDKAEFLTRLVQFGIIVPNEAREWLELNPLPGGDKPLVPINMRAGYESSDDGSGSGDPTGAST